jgi:hypothetical protein
MLKSSHFVSTGQFSQTNEAVLQASYRIADCNKPDTVRQGLIKPSLVETVRLVLREQHVEKGD